MKAQPWQERRSEYLAAKDKQAARVLRIDEFLADSQRKPTTVSAERRRGAGSGRGTSDDVAPDSNLAGGAA